MRTPEDQFSHVVAQMIDDVSVVFGDIITLLYMYSISLKILLRHQIIEKCFQTR